MTSRRIISSAYLTVIVSIFLVSHGVSQKKKKGPPPINKDAQALAKAIPVFKPGGNKQTAAKQMTGIIRILSATKRNSVTSNQALISKAMDFRNDIGAQQRSVTIGTVLKAWEAAHDYGALRNNHFTGRATRGRYEGENLVFENIVPPELLPKAAGYIGNLRIVPEPLARKKGDPLSTRDEAYAIGLKQVMYESQTRAAMLDIQKSKVEEFNQLGSAHEELWQREVNETGEAWKELPNIQVVGQRQSSPSKMNGQTYSLRVEITNMSRHPTEVEVESALIGYTEKNNRIYDLKRDSRTLKLRRSQVHEYSFRSPNVGAFKTALQGLDPIKMPKPKGKKKPKIPPQPVIYRGYTIAVKFNGKIIKTVGSDGRIAKVAAGEYPPPAKVLKPSPRRSR